MLSARAPRVSALTFVLALCAVLAAAPPVAAHSVLQSTSPADGESVKVAPATVTLTFNEPAIAIGTQLSITDPTGAVISTEPAQLIDATVVQPLAGDLPAGQYTVQWRVVSADAHPITGTFAFIATEPATAPTATAAPADGAAAAAAPLSPPAAETATAPAQDRPMIKAAVGSTNGRAEPRFPVVPAALGAIALLALIVALVMARARRAQATPGSVSPDRRVHLGRR